MSDISNKISYVIESQFPQVYQSDGPELVAFVKAYYEFMENTNKYSINENRNMLTSIDIDESLNEFVKHFKLKYLDSFPFVSATDKRFLVKHILDLYSTKGTKYSLELLMRLLFNEEVDVYYPGQDVLKPSDSEWYRPTYIEVTKSARTRGFINKQITGTRSGATAFVEGIITKRVNGKIIDVVYLSDVRGQFRRNERVTEDGIVENAPKIVGSLTSVQIDLGGRNNTIGDVFNVVTPNGKDGLVRITEIEDVTGRVDFELVDGGYGFTSAVMPGTSDFVANTTQTYVASAMLEVSNPDLDFIDFETIIQRNEVITTISSSDITANWNVGDYLVGKDSSGNFVANGVIISVANTDANGNIITTNSANASILVQCVNDTTFDYQKKVQVSPAKAFAVEEYLEEESEFTLGVSDVVGTFTVGERVEQTIREAVANTVVSFGFGKVQSANSSVIVIEEAWGVFNPGTAVYLASNPSVTASVDTSTISSIGGRGLITAVDGANVSVRVVYGDFDVANKVRGSRTRLETTVSNVIDSGAYEVFLNGNISANGVLDTITTAYANGFVVGQNTSFVGIYGNTSPFYFNEAGDFYIETSRENLISPPRDANNDIIEKESTILDIKTGNFADFNVGYLENTETVTLNTDMVGANNTANTPFKDVFLTGENSGVGFVDSITINDGGTLYSNGTVVTFTGGGLGDGDPFVAAEGIIATDTGGVITDITITTFGEGYYSEPTINLPSTSGTTANVSVNMDYGYGFVKLPDADANTYLIDALTSENFVMGTIASLTGINPGQDYNVDPFVRVYNKYIASYARGDFYVYLENVVGSFKPGEELEQVIGVTGTAKGKVISWLLTGAGTGVLHVERNAFNIAFQSSYPITGTESAATGDVTNVLDDPGSRVLGDNATITGTAIAANGIAVSAEVIDSGFGYEHGQSLTLEREDFPFIVTATANIINQGIGSGYWRTTTSHLNSEKKIHDNYYYQEYSYDIISGISLNRYEKIVRNILHVSGNELFGSVDRIAIIDSNINIANSTIEIV